MLTVQKCECCREDVDSGDTTFDADLRENVCPSCARALKWAGKVMRREVQINPETTGPFPPIYRGPFHGNSIG